MKDEEEQECTCYEAEFGHMPGCAFWGKKMLEPKRKQTLIEAWAEAGEALNELGRTIRTEAKRFYGLLFFAPWFLQEPARRLHHRIRKFHGIDDAVQVTWAPKVFLDRTAAFVESAEASHEWKKKHRFLNWWTG